jgi:dipeptidyl aminopeptidase/acylaminoacyl peptidase
MLVDPAIKAGVIWAGVVGPYPNLFNRDNFTLNPTPNPQHPERGIWRINLVDVFGLPEDNAEAWDSISANAYLEELPGPIQIHHGTADTVVPYSVSQLLYDQLEAAGQDPVFYGYGDDNHNISVSFSLAMQRSIQFFDQYVKNR